MAGGNTTDENMADDMTVRCGWCCDHGIMQSYHDEEWGIPVHDDRKHFEFLMMEVMQCGLSWALMLKKREIFHRCFAEFNFQEISKYGENDISRVLETPGMIRSRRKINAVIVDAGAFEKIRAEYGSFDKYLWGYTSGKTIVYPSHQTCAVASNELSDRISADLRRRGFKYLGSITVYSHLQACGVINDHEKDCYLYQRICRDYPVEYRE